MANLVQKRETAVRVQNCEPRAAVANAPIMRSGSRPEFRTRLGKIYCCKAEAFLQSSTEKKHAGKIQLIFTSPPFPLNTKKAYGNLQGGEYTDWLAKFAPLFKQ